MADVDERRAVLSSDTTAAEAVQVRAWRAMAPADIARIVDELSSVTRALAIAGLRERYPGASEPELVARLAEITLGRELALRVYPFLSVGAVTGVLDVLALVVSALDRAHVRWCAATRSIAPTWTTRRRPFISPISSSARDERPPVSRCQVFLSGLHHRESRAPYRTPATLGEMAAALSRVSTSPSPTTWPLRSAAWPPGLVGDAKL